MKPDVMGLIQFGKMMIGKMVETKGGWKLRIIGIYKDHILLRIPGSITKIKWNFDGTAIDAPPAFNMT